jgi:hypothetical protein
MLPLNMRKRVKIAVGIAVLLLLTGSLALNVLLYRDRENGVRLFSEEQFGMLSPGVRKLLITDLESGDTNRIAAWSSYLRHSIDLELNLKGTQRDLEALIALYRKYEQPGRSNYFGDLVNAVSARQQTVGLAKGELVRFLGQPDDVTSSVWGETLHYRFMGYGRPTTAEVEITNGAVSQIVFSVAQNSRNAP